jgi:hypothetical protein
MLKTNHIVGVVLTLCCFTFFSLLFTQTPEKPAFEVATVKPLPSMQSLLRVDIGAPLLAGDPARATCTSC